MKIDFNRYEIMNLKELLNNLDNIDLDYLIARKKLNINKGQLESAICKLQDIDISYNKDEELKDALKYKVKLLDNENIDIKYCDMIDIIEDASYMEGNDVCSRKDDWEEYNDYDSKTKKNYYCIELLLTEKEADVLKDKGFDLELIEEL